MKAVLRSAVVVSLAMAGVAHAKATQRSIEEFVAAQGSACLEFDGNPGTLCDLFVPPASNLVGWGDQTDETGSGTIFALVDYAGVADDLAGGAFGTTFSGSVTERPLADGRAEVTVRLLTKHALAWAILTWDFAGAPTIFGERVDEVLEGAEPAFADSLLHVVLINTAPGAPLPDLLGIFFGLVPGGEVVTLDFHAEGEGPLADGSPGRLIVTETGLFGTSGSPPGGYDAHRGVSDGFPAEDVRVIPVGN
jgi:hypothetical protein